MSTKNPRLNVTITLETAAILSTLAEQESVPMAHVARELIFEALELREDIALSAIAEAREVKRQEGLVTEMPGNDN